MDDTEAVGTKHEPPASSAASGERIVIVAFTASMIAALALAVVYWRGGQPQLEGVLLAVSLGGIGVGMVVWAKRFLPAGEITEERGRMASTDEEVASFTQAFEQGEQAIQRRALLLKLLGGAVGALGIAALFPIRSLGPRPGRGLFDTAFRNGVRLMTVDNEPIRPEDLSVGGVVTVWPEGHVGEPDSPTLLVKVEDPELFRPPTVARWTVGGIVAYSKLCTHTGCPVGLYQARERLLLCPCHQSTFDVVEGAKPIFGPATRPLPQLPIGLNQAGELVSTGDYREPVGPGFWNRGR
ncbi:MAG: Rieske 2Fe-2S domain-containing protein [Actinobacteria bacterium]|nr:Rieske 2Fe-2S domain-containing protein [Actinomycetota bacterium]